MTAYLRVDASNGQGQQFGDSNVQTNTIITNVFLSTASPRLLTASEADRLSVLLDGATIGPGPVDLGRWYREASPVIAGGPEPPRTISEIVERLRHLVDLRPLLTFLTRVAALTDLNSQQALRAWIAETAQNYELESSEFEHLHDQLQPRKFAVQLEPDPIGPGFYITTWAFVGRRGRLVSQPDGPVPWSRIGEVVGQLLTEEDATATVRPIVEFILPTTMLSAHVEALPWRSGRLLGSDFPVLVRPSERFAAREFCSRRTETDWFTIVPAGALPGSFSDHVVCLGLVFEPRTRSSEVERAVYQALALGLPAVVWHRPAPARHPDVSYLQQVLHGRTPSELVRVVHRLRLRASAPDAAADAPGRDLVLVGNDPEGSFPAALWDSPKREDT